MLTLSIIDVLIAAAGNLYVLLALIGVCIAVWKGKTWQHQLLMSGLIVVVFGVLASPGIYRKAKLAGAKAMFAERCKTAGEKIYKTVENVEGIYLMKIRPGDINFGDQFKLDDPYGHDSGGEMYLLNFLRGFHHQSSITQGPGFPPREGYAFVEAVEPKDGQRYRYTGRIDQPSLTDSSYSADYKRFVMDRTLAPGKQPRYGVTYDDISTLEEREYWIAGSSLKVVDLQTNEVIAERIGYMVDWAQGSQAGGRSPWLFAADNACPDFNRNRLRRVPGPGSSAQAGQSLDFVEKVLKPSK